MDSQLTEPLTIEHTQCPVCSSQSIQFVFAARDYTVSQEHFQIWQCNDCNLRFTQHVPAESEIGKYYQSEDYISHSNTQRGIINFLYQKVRNITIKRKADLVKDVVSKDRGTILDIGCGTGEFLNKMNQLEWEVLGLEPEASAREFAKDNYNLLVEPPERLFDISKGYFDVITMWHVLEHVHELHAVLDVIPNILKEKGKLIIAVPNYQSRDASIYQNQWAAYDVPRHLYHFSPQSMEILLNKHGCELLDMLPMPFDAFYVSLLSEKYTHGKPKLFKGFWQGFRSWLNSRGRVEQCSSVMYISEAR